MTKGAVYVKISLLVEDREGKNREALILTALVIGIIIFALGITGYRKLCARSAGAGRNAKGSFKLMVGASAGGAMLGGIAAGAFGVWSLVIIPAVCVLCGCAQDYFCGVISQGGNISMQKITEKVFGRKTGILYGTVVMLLMASGCALFVKIGTQCIGGIIGIFTSEQSMGTVLTFIIAAVIFVAAAIMSRAKGNKLTRLSGACLVLLIISAVLILIFTALHNADMEKLSLSGLLIPASGRMGIMPGLFAAAICAMLSGFNSAATVCFADKDSSNAGNKFFTAMLFQGIIAEAWAAAAIAGASADASSPAGIITAISNNAVGAVVLAASAIAGVYSAACAIKCAVRTIANMTDADENKKNVIAVVLILTALVSCAAIIDTSSFVTMVFLITDTLAALAHFAVITACLTAKEKGFVIPMASGVFYIYAIGAYLMNSPMGMNISSMRVCYTIALVLALIYAGAVMILSALAAKRKKLDEIL